MKARKLQFSDKQLHISEKKILSNQRSNLPPNLPKMEHYQRQNSPKSGKVARKLRSMAKIERLHENAKVVRSATLQFSGGTKYTSIQLNDDLLFCTVNKLVLIGAFVALLHSCIFPQLFSMVVELLVNGLSNIHTNS